MLNEVKYQARTHAVGIFSLEMSSVQLWHRMYSDEGNVSFRRIRDGHISSEDWGRVTDAASKLDPLPIYISDAPHANMNIICQTARQMKRDHDISILYIDYLQLIDGPKGVKRYEAVGDISRRGKQLAKELEIPVVALAQLNRECETRSPRTPRPILSDLRESGSIEQDADIVKFLYRHSNYDDRMDSYLQHVTEVLIKKHRNGRTGTCLVGFWGDNQRFADIDHSTVNEYQNYMNGR